MGRSRRALGRAKRRRALGPVEGGEGDWGGAADELWQDEGGHEEWQEGEEDEGEEDVQEAPAAEEGERDAVEECEEEPAEAVDPDAQHHEDPAAEEWKRWCKPTIDLETLPLRMEPVQPSALPFPLSLALSLTLTHRVW